MGVRECGRTLDLPYSHTPILPHAHPSIRLISYRSSLLKSVTESISSEERRITRLEAQKRDPERASAHVDGAFAFGVHQELILKHGLHVGRALSVEEQQRIEQDDAVLRARAAAFDYLAHKPRTEGELRRRLRRHDYGPAVIEQVAARLQELGYLDDAAYAQEYVRARFASKGYGPARIRRELLKRGVEEPLIDQALEAHLDAEATREAAREHARKKWQRLQDESDPRRRRQKLYGYLRRRGFTSDTIRHVTDELEREA